MSRFVVCPSCERHVRRSEESCPFCESTVPSALRNQVQPAPPSGLSRARAYAFRAALVASSSAVACGGGTEGPPTDGGTDGSGATAGTGGVATGGTGGKAGNAGTGGTNTGGNAGTGNTGFGGAGGWPMPYGCVWPGECGPIYA